MAYDYLFKFVILGDKAVGKSSICNFIENNNVNYTSPTIGVEYMTANFNINNEIVKGQFWDISGDRSYLKITESYFKDNAGIIIVFDKSDKRSFTNIKKWIKLLGNNITKSEILLLGNKCDKSNIKVSTRKASKFAHDNNFLYAETSAKTGMNIITSIERLIQTILLNNLIDHPGIKIGYNTLTLPINKPNKRYCCFEICKFM
jgi:small GTP-binding protein